MPTVLIHHGLPVPVDGNDLRGERDDLAVRTAGSEAENRELLPETDVLVTSNALWEDAFLEGLEAGDWVQTLGAGYDAYPVEAFRERGIVLTNAPDVPARSASEHAIALALAFTRGLPTYLDQQRRREWTQHVETELAGRRMTVLGLGRIGEEVARRAHAFEMDVWGVKRDPDAYDGCLPPEQVAAGDDLFDLLPETDLLVVVVPLTDETRGMVDAPVFEALPDAAILVNVARGEVVDEGDLVAALEGDEIAAAGLDVTAKEPLPPGSPLWDREDVLVTPHVAGVTDRYPEQFAELFLDHYDDWRAGRDPGHRVV